MTNNQNLPSASTKAMFTGCAMSRLFPAAEFYHRKSVLWVKKVGKALLCSAKYYMARIFAADFHPKIFWATAPLNAEFGPS